MSDKIQELELLISSALEHLKSVKEEFSLPSKPSKRRQSIQKFSAAAYKAIATRNKKTKKT